MKLVLEFEMPDDQYDVWCAYHATQTYRTITEINQLLRQHFKYNADGDKTLANIQQAIVELHNEIGEPL